MPELPAAFSGSLATRPDWLARRFDDLAGFWLIDQQSPAATRRVAGTLWWSMSVYALCSAPVDALVAGRPVPDPTPTRVRCRLRPEAALTDVRHERVLTGLIGPALRAALTSVVEPVAEVSGASTRSLWAIAADALANRALETGGWPRAGQVCELVADGIGPVLPRPRFVAVGGRTFVRRNSCCLYYFSPVADGKCTSCPRRAPLERRALLSELVGNPA